MRSCIFAPGLPVFTDSTREISQPLTCFIMESPILLTLFFDDNDDEAVADWILLVERYFLVEIFFYCFLGSLPNFASNIGRI